MDSIKFLECQDVFKTLKNIHSEVTATILDPWYNRGVGGVRSDYNEWLIKLVQESLSISKHVFLWGFPEIVCQVLNHLPEETRLVAWLIWYYKNCPSVTKGWRSAQYTCLHLAHNDSTVYPENFFNEAQKERFKTGKMRFIPGPLSVIESPLNIGFINKKEQTGHPAQKPIEVIKPLVLMTTREGDTVLDPMCGSGTTGVVCLRTNRKAILGDESDEYLTLAKNRIEQEAVLS